MLRDLVCFVSGIVVTLCVAYIISFVCASLAEPTFTIINQVLFI